MKKFVVSLVLVLSSSLSNANGFYGGIAYSLLESDITVMGTSFESEPSAFKLVGGASINKNFAIESVIGVGVKDDDIGPFDAEFELHHVFGLYGVGIFPANDTLSLYGKVGVVSLEFEDVGGDKASGSGVGFGVGTEIKFTQHVSGALEYNLYPDVEYDDFDEIEVETKSIDFRFNFRF